MSNNTGASGGFQAQNLTAQPPTFSLPGGVWVSLFETPCAFEDEWFLKVMLNLIKNPNITSTHLFRAEIFYDSLNDASVSPDTYRRRGEHFSDFTKHMKAEYRPLIIDVPGYEHLRTVVRRMIPRNPQLDKALVQTCHIFKSIPSVKESPKRHLVLYLPHVSSVDEIPWYHPAVRSVAFLHEWRTGAVEDDETSVPGSLSLHYQLFTSAELSDRLHRTGLKLIQLIHKHAVGQKAGYVKRVHHDLVVTQARFQDTYSRLKAKYAKELIRDWVEQTDPTKHVFEDLGIAAFLIELWKDMYSGPTSGSREEIPAGSGDHRPPFPGFVDIGCGNGVLVHVLLQEQYSGWGFDARKRKTWATFPSSCQARLRELVLVPSVFRRERRGDKPTAQHELTNVTNISPLTILPSVPNHPQDAGSPITPTNSNDAPHFHDGLFPPETFIISNHADELTAWTPLLAHISNSPFIVIPCCSHNFAGARFRAPVSKRHNLESNTTQRGSFQISQKKQPSAYSALCSWVAQLSRDVGYEPEKEVLRIPSTRNVAIIGRKFRKAQIIPNAAEEDYQKREGAVEEIIEREMGVSVDQIAKDWIDHAVKLVQSRGTRH